MHRSVDNIDFGVKTLCVNEMASYKQCTDRVVLDVVAVVSNPVRFQRRYQLFNEFVERMKLESNVRITTVELQQNCRPFMTNATIKLRTKDELWHKENLINIAVQNLPVDWQYVAWIDADIEFQNKNWVRDTLEQLQTYDVVQLFQNAIDLGPTGETMLVHTSFMALYVNGEPMNNYSKHKNYKNGHTGYAWACTRKAFNNFGTLPNYCILGSADSHIALALIGEVEKSLHPKLNENYKKLLRIFQDRCERHIKRNVSYVNGTINHFYHGGKSSRQYSSRWCILLNNDYDPLADIKYDSNSVLQLEDKKIKLRDEIRKYFRSRWEDDNMLREDTQFSKAKWI